LVQDFYINDLEHNFTTVPNTSDAWSIPKTSVKGVFRLSTDISANNSRATHYDINSLYNKLKWNINTDCISAVLSNRQNIERCKVK
jgi:hypothetical protein